MYLKDGINGLIVPKGDTQALADKLRLLLTDDDLRSRFSDAAKEENKTNAHIDRLCEGFVECLGRLVPGVFTPTNPPKEGLRNTKLEAHARKP